MAKEIIPDEMEEPKDLGLKLGTKNEVIWTEVRDSLKATIESDEKNMMVNKEMLALAERKIKEENAKFKKLGTKSC